MRKPRRVERKIKAAVIGHKAVQITTYANDSIGIFEIPPGKDDRAYMEHHGWAYLGPEADEPSVEYYAKIVTL